LALAVDERAARAQAPEFPSMEEPMATKPQTLGWSVWTIILVIVLLILVVGMAYLAY
jgi:hypothetical protein